MMLSTEEGFELHSEYMKRYQKYDVNGLYLISFSNKSQHNFSFFLVEIAPALT